MKRVIKFWNFLTNDIWRVTEDEVTRKKFSFYTAVKVVYLTADRFSRDRIIERASALTYSTLLAIIPILAVLFSIARSFGFNNLVEGKLTDILGGVSENTEMVSRFVDSYLSQAKSGVFLGIGLVLLLWTILSLTMNIENAFNKIWQVKKARSMYRKITDYFSMFLLMPILLVISAGISIFMSTIVKGMDEYIVLGSFSKFLVKLIPFVITWFMFTGIYTFMPNTKVKFRHALIAGILAGTAFQCFQYIYISGQLWVTRYNAIYGSFAAIPLLLLWLQMSWTICLLGVVMTYSSQNVHNFNFDNDTRNISRRYSDFTSILIMSLIAKRFANNLEPYSAEDIAQNHHIPINLTNQILYQLMEVKLIHEVMTDEKSENISYQPSVDINRLTVAYLLERIEKQGSENFKIDHDQEFLDEWKVLLDLKRNYYAEADKILLKDL